MSAEKAHSLKPLTSYVEVSIESIQLGKLMDRSLFVFLQKNNKYVQIIKPLFPVDERVLKIIKQTNVLYTNEHTIDSLYPELLTVVETLKNASTDQGSPSFERNKKIKNILEPILPFTFRDSSIGNWDPTAPKAGLSILDAKLCVFLIHRTFGIPAIDSLRLLENISVGVYEISIVRASVAAIFALLLGYTDYVFIQQYVQSVFFEEIKILQNGISTIPGFDPRGRRFGFIIQDDILPQPSGAYNDECIDIVNYVRWLYRSTYLLSEQKNLVAESQLMMGDEIPISRAFNKLKKELNLILAKADTEIPKEKAA